MHSEISNIIHITAWTIEVKIIRYRHERDKDEYKARLELEDGGHLDWEFQSMSKVEVSPGKFCKGIILGHNFKGLFPRYLPEPAILVCGKHSGTMERIGLGWVRLFTRYDKDGIEETRGSPISAEEIISGGRPSTDIVSKEPPVLVKSWEEIRLG